MLTNVTGRSAPASIFRALVVAAAVAALTACGGGGGGASSSLALSLDQASTAPGGQAVPLHATAGAVVPTWSLSGPGSLSATSGTDVVYTPPAMTPGGEAATAVVTVSAGGESRQAQISLAEVDAPGHHWHVALEATTWHDVAWGGGRFVAVGENGVIVTSVDGRTWTHVDSAARSSWMSVAYAPGIGWVALGVDNEVLTSPDGIAWTPQAPLPVQVRPPIAVGNGVLVVAGPNTALESADGKAWTKLDRPLHAVAFGNGQFTGMTSAGFVYSVDGRHWTAGTGSVSPPDDFSGAIAFGNGLFVATDGTRLSTSPDGVTWTTLPGSPMNAATVSFLDGQFFLQGNGAVSISTDGLTWTYTSMDVVPRAVNGDGSMLVAIHGDLVSGATLDDTTTVAPGSLGIISAIGCASASCVGTTFDGSLVTTVDGVHWNTTHPAAMQGFVGTAIATNGAGDGFLLAGLAQGVDAQGNWAQLASFASSADGLTWSTQSPAGTAAPGPVFVGLAKSPTGYLAIDGYGNTLSSPDGKAWTPLGHVAAGEITGITFGAGRYVVVDMDGWEQVSTDGKTWSTGTRVLVDGQPFGASGVAFNGQVFATVQWNGQVAISTDGLAWSVHSSATTQNLHAIAGAAGGELVAVGDQGVVETSADGIHWKLRDAGTTRALWAVSATSSGFIAGGADNTIVTSTN